MTPATTPMEMTSAFLISNAANANTMTPVISNSPVTIAVALSIGKAPHFATTYENERRHFQLDEWDVGGDEQLAGWLLGGSVLPERVDLTSSNEWILDHAFSIPLVFLRPGFDIPVVPIHTNTNIPPLPRPSRFAALGEHLADSIESAPFARRVAVVATGHLATDIGGPKGFLGGASPDPQFDSSATRWMADGDVAAAVAGSNLERLLRAGNVTPQFLNFVTSLAAAGGRPADISEATPSRFAQAPFFYWDLTS